MAVYCVNMKDRTFDILLIGGASGTGKSKIAYQLGSHYRMNVIQVDDFQLLVESCTKESDYPVFHYWRNHFDEAKKQPMSRKLEIMIAYANELSKLLDPVIISHLDQSRSTILEGDFISPNLCKRLLTNKETRSRVKCIFMVEDTKELIVENFLDREGSMQEDRAELSFHYNNWLKEQSEGSDIVLVSSRPWNTCLKRITKKIH